MSGSWGGSSCAECNSARHQLRVDKIAKFIAADVNKSNSVTANDIVELRKIILGINSTFPQNTSWRFVPRNFQFPNPSNPFQTSFPEKMIFDSLAVPPFDADFFAIKTGDVSGNAATNISDSDDRSNLPNINFLIENQDFIKGSTLELFVKLSEKSAPVSAFQMTLAFDPSVLEFENLTPLDNMDATQFSLQRVGEGLISVSWNSATTAPLQIAPRFLMKFRALASGELARLVWLTDHPTLREVVLASGERAKPQLFFQNMEQHRDLEVLQNRPNPFTESTEIGIFLPTAAPVVLTIFDLNGKILLEQQHDWSAGGHVWQIKKSELGKSSGCFWYAVQTPSARVVRKMVILE